MTNDDAQSGAAVHRTTAARRPAHDREEHTIVVGGGVIGVCAAYYLARPGRAVTLIDRGAFDTCASTGNAGIIALGHPPMPRPGLVRQTLRMLFDPVNPLYIPPRFDLQLLKWLWQFRRSCNEPHFEHSMRILAELGWATGALFDQLVDDERLECEYHRTGWIEVFRSQQRFQQGLDEAELLRTYGYHADVLSGDELVQREPAFLPGVAGAVHYTDSRFANPQRFIAEVAERAMQHGAAIRTRTEVRSIIVDGGRFIAVELDTGERIAGDDLVLAGGIWSSELARSIGVNVPMQAGKGYNMVITRPQPCPSTTCVLAETFVAVTPIGGGLRLAGTVEFSGINDRMLERRVEALRVGSRQFLMGIDEAQTLSMWCGLRPCTADGLPVIGWAPGVEGVFIATGHAMMGFALGPVTGKLVAEAILDGRTSIDVSALSPERYARRRRHRRQASERLSIVNPR
jgi:D-amino-acid dehydrogenase